MENIKIKVTHYYNHPILYPFMPPDIFESLEEAFLQEKEKAVVPRKEYEHMIEDYFETLKN
jgi:hypothetical protein